MARLIDDPVLPTGLPMIAGPPSRSAPVAGGLRRLRKGQLDADGTAPSPTGGVEGFLTELGQAVDEATEDGHTVLVIRLRHRPLQAGTALDGRRPTVDDEITQRLLDIDPGLRVVAVSGSELAAFVPRLRRRSDAQPLLDSVMASLAEPITVDGLPHHLSPMAGGALFGAENATVDRLLDAAALALAEADAAIDSTHRGQLFHPYQRVRHERRAGLERALRQAVLDNTTSTAFQPVVELAGGRIIGFEVFARWFRAGGRPVGTAEFIDLGRELGLLHLLSRQVLERGIASARSWLDDGLIEATPARPFTVWANVSSTEVLHPSFLDTMGAIVERDPRMRIGFELTPTPPGEAREVHDRLRILVAAGARAAVGDFGVGPANLGALPTMPFDTVTIDGSLIRPVAGNAPARHVVGALIELARRLGLASKAQAIENPAQAEVLRRLRCSAGQGYYFGPPMLADDMRRHLAA